MLDFREAVLARALLEREIDTFLRDKLAKFRQDTGLEVNDIEVKFNPRQTIEHDGYIQYFISTVKVGVTI